MLFLYITWVYRGNSFALPVYTDVLGPAVLWCEGFFVRWRPVGDCELTFSSHWSCSLTSICHILRYFCIEINIKCVKSFIFVGINCGLKWDFLFLLCTCSRHWGMTVNILIFAIFTVDRKPSKIVHAKLIFNTITVIIFLILWKLISANVFTWQNLKISNHKNWYVYSIHLVFDSIFALNRKFELLIWKNESFVPN